MLFVAFFAQNGAAELLGLEIDSFGFPWKFWPCTTCTIHLAPEDVEIDDLIPCDRYGAPLFAQLEGDSSLDAMPVWS